MNISGNSMSVLIQAIDNVTNSLPAYSPAISQTAGTILITAIWQGAVVASCLAISLKLTSRISAALRFSIWSAGFLAVVGLPFLPLLLQANSAFPATPSLEGSFAAGATGPLLSVDIRWSIVLTVLWTAFSIYRLADLAIHSFRLRRLWKTAKPVEPAVQILQPLAASQLWGRRPVQVCTTQAIDRPSVIGFFAPRILIPEWLFDRLTPGEIEQIVLHETEHLRRGDDWTNLLQKLSLAVFPLNPVLLWMERKLCLEREMACDEAVVRVTHAPRAYAACLASLAERGIQRRTEALSLGAWQRRPELVHRVHSILRRRQALGALGARTVAGILACGLVVGSIELARCPQLVAFTPYRATETNDLAAAQLSRSPMHTKMVDTGFIEVPQSMTHDLATPAMHKPRIGELKPTVPPRSMCSRTYRCSDATSDVRRIASEPSPRNLEQAAPKQVLLKADALASAPVSEEQEQSWIVLTTWEETSAPAQPARQSKATEQAEDQPVAQNAKGRSPVAQVPVAQVSVAQTPAQPSRQLKVTRLIFRVVPANSVFTLPTAVPVSGGWLVIQL